MKKAVSMLLAFILLLSVLLPASAEEAAEDDGTVIIALDPGHGGNGGTAYRWGGTYISETEAVLKIAKYLKEELESYDGVKVFLTRETNGQEEYDKIYEMIDRCNIAVQNNSDLLISLHINGDNKHRSEGACVLIPNGNYRPELAREDYRLGECILDQLHDIGLGIYDKGLITRDSETKPQETYPDGSVADYYGIVRGGILFDFLAVIIEHGFIDNYYDATSFLSNDEQLKKLAHADCLGIVEYLGLKKPLESGHGTALTDISDCWARDSIERAVSEGWVKGYTDRSFRPFNSVNRGEFVTFLGRAAGVADTCTAQVFPDVPEMSFCAAYVQWAAENSIVEGYADGKFHPEKLITREQMAKIMTRYLALLGNDVSSSQDLSSYGIVDAKTVSPWAREYVAFCYANGLLQGTKTGSFEPLRFASRAEACTVLTRMIDFDLQNRST